MPNWCNNTIEIRHSDPAMLERVKKGYAEGKLLNEFLPIPEELNIVAGRVGDDNDPKQIALEAAEKSNLEKYGHANWYDWCVANWGTKWDVGLDSATDFQPEEIPGGLVLYFDSAWAPPVGAYEMLVDKFGFSIRAYYYEPGMAFCGVWEDGDDNYFEIGGMSADQVAEDIPAELDEAFGISENIREWEEMEEDE